MDSTFQHVQMAAESKIKFSFIDITSVTATVAQRIQCLAPNKQQWQEKLAFNREKPWAGPGWYEGSLRLKEWDGE